MNRQLYWYTLRVRLTNRKHRQAKATVVVDRDCEAYLLSGLTLFSDFPLFVTISISGRALWEHPLFFQPGPGDDIDRSPHGLPLVPEIACKPSDTIAVTLAMPKEQNIGRSRCYPVLQLNGSKVYPNLPCGAVRREAEESPQ